MDIVKIWFIIMAILCTFLILMVVWCGVMLIVYAEIVLDIIFGALIILECLALDAGFWYLAISC